MLRKLTTLLSLVLLATSADRGYGFSFLGNQDTWMRVEIGYLPQAGGGAVDIGGPMNIGDEYRWNSPIFTYGFDSAFLDYFGAEGIRAVEAGIKMLNDLPPVSEMSADLSEFPIDTRRVNYTASALRLLDLKSKALSFFMNQIGVGCAERWTWCLRERVVINNIPIYTVIKRNFDPVTWHPSSYVNGQLYTYRILQVFVDPGWDAVELAVDPAQPILSTVAAFGNSLSLVDSRGSDTVFAPGFYYAGLTRDDVGALRYLLRPGNQNTEALPPNSVGAPGGPTAPASATSIAAPAPWGTAGGGLVFGTTNAFTNFVATVDIALRGGVDKISFVRVEYDSILGATLQPVVVQYQDTYVTNGVAKKQGVQRVITQPDLLLTTGDLGTSATGYPVLYDVTSDGWRNTSTTGNAGPGVVLPPLLISMSKIGPFMRNSPETLEEQGAPGFSWGWFDGTTNAPKVFPDSLSIQEIENLVLTGGRP